MEENTTEKSFWNKTQAEQTTLDTLATVALIPVAGLGGMLALGYVVAGASKLAQRIQLRKLDKEAAQLAMSETPTDK